ncbi:MAG: hypothetical protein M3154_05225, partial [Candidatus Eremiobacteraeota bacterium]|nr:hypothetical protein [Candidatus Eremiobacteraeota bacterium]
VTAALLLQPALVDAVLALLAGETLWLVWRGRRRANGAPGLAFALSFAGAGAGLLLALRAVLAGWPAWTALVGLAVAGAANVWHVAAGLSRARDAVRFGATVSGAISRQSASTSP